MKNISGNLLRKLRESNGYSLREFSKMIYVSKSTLQRWEKSYLPDDGELLNNIAGIFNITVDEMYEKSQEKNEKIPTDKQLTEMQFGVKGLALVLGFLAAFVLIFVLLHK